MANAKKKTVKGFNGATRLHAWKLDAIDNEVRGLRASMGPRVFTRGNDKALGDFASSIKLQWGHASSRVETCSGSSDTRAFHRLQWGHASSRVETQGCKDSLR